MKNWLYIPFLLLMAITYTRVIDNMEVENVAREPASVDVDFEIECLDLPSQFNPHFNSDQCL